VKVLLISANREMLPSPVVPLGVLWVAGAIRDAHDVRVLDLCFEADPVLAVQKEVASFMPDVIGVGLRNLHTNAYDGTPEHLLEGYASVVRAARAITRAPIVLGGAGFSLRPTTLLERLGADHGVVGEGEHVFRDMLRMFERGRTPPRIVKAGVPLGLLARAPKTSNLDELAPPARDLCDPRYFAFDGTDNVQTKRGCAFQCAYCDYPDLEGNKVRVRDPEKVADEVIARSKQKNVSYLFFVDSVFNVPRSHAIAVCNAIEKRGAPIPWVCYASPAGLDADVVAAMARAGCVGVEVGSDSGSPAILERLRKPFPLSQIVRAHELFRDHGIRECHTFVLGAMGETAEEAKETLRFVERLDPDVAVFMAFMEDREDRTIDRAPHREAILELLDREARRHDGWVVPELGIRFGEKITRIMQRNRLRGPSWLHLRAPLQLNRSSA
jgi:radical SAM superfamily enzyme YgiQ (UPF0313 family)